MLRFFSILQKGARRKFNLRGLGAYFAKDKRVTRERAKGSQLDAPPARRAPVSQTPSEGSREGTSHCTGCSHTVYSLLLLKIGRLWKSGSPCKSRGWACDLSPRPGTLFKWDSGGRGHIESEGAAEGIVVAHLRPSVTRSRVRFTILIFRIPLYPFLHRQALKASL